MDVIIKGNMLEQEKNMLVSAAMPRGTRSNPPTGGSDSGFTMSFEFNGLSRSGVLCGEDFISYRPFKDSPEEVLEDTEFDWGALAVNVGWGLLAVTVVAGMAAYGASLVFTGGGTAAFAPYVVGGLSAVGGSWFVTNQAEKDYMRGEVSSWTSYVTSGLAGSAKGALAGGAFYMAPYAAPVLLNQTGAIYAGSMLPVSEETMLGLTEVALYSTAFSNIVIQGSEMAGDVTGKNPVREALGEELYHTAGELAKMGVGAIMIAGLHNPEFYVKNKEVAHFEQISRAGKAEENSDDIKNDLANRIKDIRGQMPNTNLAKRGNMAVADVKVSGVKENFVAHSKINAELDKGAGVAEFSYLKPEDKRIFATYVDDQYPRYHDTEAKILEDIASQITDPNSSGTINLYSELPCCQSCSNIILEFKRMFPNIKLNIYVK